MRVDPLLTKPIGLNQAVSGRLHPIARFVLPQQGMPACLFGEISGQTVPTGETVLVVASGLTYSSESYFNSLFLGHLRDIAEFQEVALILELSGAGTLSIVSKSKAKERVIAGSKFAGSRTGLALRVAYTDIADSDYLFFRLEAGDEPIALFSAHWDIVCADERPVKLTIGICTHNRDHYLLPNLQHLIADTTLMECIHCLIVVDQGDDEHADATRRACLSHPKLVWRRQRNLGGSGGFSRAMFEAKENGSTHVLLLDDDATYCLESAWRLVQLLKFPGPPRIWGAPMFSLSAPSQIYEVSGIYQRNFNRIRNVGRGIKIDGGKGLSRALKAASKKGYSAWFFCCFDVQPGCDESGSLPFFLHLDDVELSYRLQTFGYRHSVIPGLAIWHEASKSRPPWRVLLKVRNKLILSTIPHIKSRIPGAIFAWIICYMVGEAIVGGPGRLNAVVCGMETFARGPSAVFDIFNDVSEFRRRAPCSSRESAPRFLVRVLVAFRNVYQARKKWMDFNPSQLASWRNWKAAWSDPG